MKNTLHVLLLMVFIRDALILSIGANIAILMISVIGKMHLKLTDANRPL